MFNGKDTITNNILESGLVENGIKIENSSKTVSNFIKIFEKSEQYWINSPVKYLRMLSKSLQVDFDTIVTMMDKNHSIILKNKNTWLDHHETEIRANIFFEIYKIFYERGIETVESNLWKNRDKINLLYNKYSLLANLLLYREIAKSISQEFVQAENTINLLVSHFKTENYEIYINTIDSINLEYNSRKKKRFGVF